MTDALPARLIDAAIASLRRNVVPLLTDDAAAVHVDLVTRVLWLASYELSRGDADASRLHAAETALLDEIDALVGDGEGAPLAVSARLKRAAPALLHAARAQPAARDLLDRLIETERAALIARDPDIADGSAVVYRGGKIESDRGAPPADAIALPDAASLTAYLRRIEDDPDLVARDARVVPGGFSKTTLFFDVMRGDQVEPLVMRRDMSHPFMDKTVSDEFPLLRRLHDAGFPVAEPLRIEADRAPFGSPFLLSRRVAGTCDFRRWAADPVSVEQFSRQLARLMARLHRMDLTALGYAPPDTLKSAGALMAEELERWAAMFERVRSRDHPLIELALAWLRDNIPADAFDRPGRIVHGDIGFHNLLFQDGQVSAVLDWEFSHLGDPLEDLVYTRIFIDQIMDWGTFKGFYRAEGGLDCSPEAELFYGTWSRIRNAIGSLDGARLFDTALPGEIKFAVSGHIFVPYLAVEAAEAIARSFDAG